MITLYDNPFSPFARKVRMVLNYKGLPFHSIDALAIDQLAGLASRNSRVEVPVVVDGDLTIVDSADIVAYLEDRYPTPAILSRSPERRARARHWQRVADRVLDAVIHDISLWSWPTHHRRDEPPRGLLTAGRRDLEAIMRQLDDDLDEDDYICGEFSIADIAVFPHVSSLKPVGIRLDDENFPRVRAWFRRMRTQPVVRSDLEYVANAGIEKFIDQKSPYEGEKVVWRGDRIEWLLCNGFDTWWSEERAAGRAVIPSNIHARS